MSAHDQAAHLGELTRMFYERAHDSFSLTRQSAWRGWDELWSFVGPLLEMRDANAMRLRVADVACGNLRFVRFLRDKAKVPFEVYAFDGCEPLLVEGLRVLSGVEESGVSVHAKVCDIALALSEEHDFLAAIEPCDLTVAFGFMHHLPLLQQREQLLRYMIEHTAEGGFLAVSFWQFADDERMRRKAEGATAFAQREGLVGDLAPNDYLLGWQDDAAAFRFCHHFTEEEIDALSASLTDNASESVRFSADGKSGASNRYVLWRRHG